LTARKAKLVDDRAGQQAGVAHRFDFHLAEHLRHNDLDVLVIDIDPLTAIKRSALRG